MTERYERQPVPRWYWIAAIGSLLFFAALCWDYLADVTKDGAVVSVDRRDLIRAQPIWQIAAYALSVWVGLLGTLLLVLRRRSAEPFLIVSLVASFVSYVPYATVPFIRNNITVDDIAFAIGILLVTGSIWSFARHSHQRGWLH